MLSAVPGTTDTYDSSMQMSAYDTLLPFTPALPSDYFPANADLKLD